MELKNDLYVISATHWDREWRFPLHKTRMHLVKMMDALLRILEGNPDFVKVAEAYGAMGLRIKEKKEVVPALKKALKYPGPVFLDFIVAAEENVFPMVPAGANIRQMISGLA